MTKKIYYGYNILMDDKNINALFKKGGKK